MRAVVPLVGALVAVVAALAITRGVAPDQSGDVTRVPPGAPLPLAVEQEPGDPDPDLNAPPVALAPPGGAIVQNGVVRIPRPRIDPNGQRRVGIQIGHLETTDVPAEYGARIQQQTGASVDGVTEVDVTTAIARRMATLLRAQGIAVDILPTTVPEGYLADVFIALHCDDDGTGELSGFKMAHSTRRAPYEDALVTSVKDAYAAATGLGYDVAHVSRAMISYYAFNWGRFQHATSPFTPSTIIELGFLSNDGDRDLLVDHADIVAGALVSGILAFLDATPRSKLFGEDLLIPRAPLRQGPIPSPTTPP